MRLIPIINLFLFYLLTSSLTSTPLFSQENNIRRSEYNYYNDTMIANIYSIVHETKDDKIWNHDGTYIGSLRFSEDSSKLLSINLLQLEGKQSDWKILSDQFSRLIGLSTNTTFSADTIYLVPIITSVISKVDQGAVSIKEYESLNNTLTFIRSVCCNCKILPLYEAYRLPDKR